MKSEGPPGEWICDECDFRLHSRIINATTGDIGAPRVQEIPSCENECGLMRRVTWQEDAEAGNRTLDWLNRYIEELERAVRSYAGDRRDAQGNDVEWYISQMRERASQRWVGKALAELDE